MKSDSKLSHLHPHPDDGLDPGSRKRRSRRPLPEGVPSGPFSLRAGGRRYDLTEKAIRTYCDEYGLEDGLDFDFGECLRHIEDELNEALRGKPDALDDCNSAVRLHSRNLIFTLAGTSVMGIRISLKYSSRSKTTHPAPVSKDA